MGQTGRTGMGRQGAGEKGSELGPLRSLRRRRRDQDRGGDAGGLLLPQGEVVADLAFAAEVKFIGSKGQVRDYFTLRKQ